MTEDRGIWTAKVLTLFPEMFPGPLAYSLAGKALAAGAWSLETFDIRDHAMDRHGTVDGSPFGGGAGMVMRADVVDAAIENTATGDAPLIYLTPRGEKFSQAHAVNLVTGSGVTLICGRYEGIDQRVLDVRNVIEISLGDFVLSGGESAALALIDACVRLLPGVMGSEASLFEESFNRGLLEYPLLYKAGGLVRPESAGRPALRPSREDRYLANRAGAGDNARTTARSLGSLQRRTKEPKGTKP